MKVFLSQPMAGRTKREIKAERRGMLVKASYFIGQEVEEVGSYFEEAPQDITASGDSEALWYLGKSLQKMAEADAVVFIPGWEGARGCHIEHMAARYYGKDIYEF